MDRGYYFHAGNGTAGSGADNGNVFGITNYRDTARFQTFTYDALKPLFLRQSLGYTLSAACRISVSPPCDEARKGKHRVTMIVTQALIESVLARMNQLSPERFVDLIVDHLRRRDDFHNVEPGPTRGRDQRVDIFALHRVGDEPPVRAIFQCKHYTSKSPNAKDVTEVVEGIGLKKADEGYLVSTGYLTPDGRQAADNTPDVFGKRVHYQDWCHQGLVFNFIKNTPSILVRWFPDLRSQLEWTHEHSPLCPSFEIVPSRANSPSAVKADRFYDGYPPTWEELFACLDIDRTVYSQEQGIRWRARQLLAGRSATSVVLLLGVAGTGKTTLLKRLAVDMTTLGVLTLRLRDDWLLSAASLAQQIQDVARESGSALLILMDNAADLVFDRNILQRTIRELEPSQPVVFALADQPDRWNLARRQLSCLNEGENYFPERLHHLFQNECEGLVDRILQYESDGTLSVRCNLSRSERLALCNVISERQLLIAMLQMRHGTEFRKIIEREYELIPTEEGKSAYSLVCYFNTFRLSLPINLVLRALRIEGHIAIERLRNSTQGLFGEDGLGLTARHAIISTVVSRHVFGHPESKKEALRSVISGMSHNEGQESSPEEIVFRRIFSGRNMYRRIATDLNRNTTLLRGLYSEVCATVPKKRSDLLKLVATSQGQTERMLGNLEEARVSFKTALALDPGYVFAHRQMAWLEHFRGDWTEAAKMAIQAARLAEQDFLTQYHCARILSLGKVDDFREAERYYLRALEIDPSQHDLVDDWNDYQTAKRVLGYFSDLRAEQLVPEAVYEEMRPGLAFIRTIHGPNSKQFREKLVGNLRGMEEQTFGDIGDLYEKIAGIKIEKNKMLHALVLCNVARLRYLAWYHSQEEHEADDTEELFKTSLSLNGHDPFTHCWYGTFLKEVRRDFESARFRYKRAIELGDGRPNSRLNRHPLFLNNMALLIMDEVRLKRVPGAKLEEAKLLLDEAVRRVRESKADFQWPEESLSLCVDLMREAGVGER
jgi:tetratricopeptide (TPR) repeat protein